MTYKIDIISFQWESGGVIALIEYKVNSSFRRMRILKEDIKSCLLLCASHLGINENNVDDMIANEDPKYNLENEFLIIFLQNYHKV